MWSGGESSGCDSAVDGTDWRRGVDVSGVVGWLFKTFPTNKQLKLHALFVERCRAKCSASAKRPPSSVVDYCEMFFMEKWCYVKTGELKCLRPGRKLCREFLLKAGEQRSWRKVEISSQRTGLHVLHIAGVILLQGNVNVNSCSSKMLIHIEAINFSRAAVSDVRFQMHISKIDETGRAQKHTSRFCCWAHVSLHNVLMWLWCSPSCTFISLFSRINE